MSNSEILTGWKQIASFFQRHEDTVKSWNKKDPMPIYKIRGEYCSWKIDLLKWMEKYKQNNRLED